MFILVFGIFIMIFLSSIVMSLLDSERVSIVEIEPQKTKKAKELAYEWDRQLLELGETVSRFKLIELIENNKNSLSNQKRILFESFFKKHEYQSFLRKIIPKTSDLDMMNDGFKGSFDIETLSSAVQAKHLSRYIDNLEEAIFVLKSKEESRCLNDVEKEIMDDLNELRKNHLDKLLKISKVELLNNDFNKTFQVSFSKVESNGSVLGFHVSELNHISRNDLLLLAKAEELDSETIEIKEELKKQKRSSTKKDYSTSLPLSDINSFLNENDLPEDVTKELQETMHLIEKQLLERKKMSEEEKQRMESKTLIKTAKEYHGIK